MSQDDLAGHPFSLSDETKEDVLGSKVVVAEFTALVLGKHQDSTGPVSKALKHLLISDLLSQLIGTTLPPRCDIPLWGRQTDLATLNLFDFHRETQHHLGRLRSVGSGPQRAAEGVRR